MKITELINENKNDFISLCRKHNVKKLYAFGSATTPFFNFENSDIDLLIEVDEDDPIEKGEKLISIWNLFEKFFNRKVDLLTMTSIKNTVLRKRIDETKILVYES